MCFVFSIGSENKSSSPSTHNFPSNISSVSFMVLHLDIFISDPVQRGVAISSKVVSKFIVS